MATTAKHNQNMGDDMQEEAMMVVLGLLLIECRPHKRKDCGKSPGDGEHANWFYFCLLPCCSLGSLLGSLHSVLRWSCTSGVCRFLHTHEHFGH